MGYFAACIVPVVLLAGFYAIGIFIYRKGVSSEKISETTEEFDGEGNMKPPWQACPHIPRTSMGWRMGYGEDYLDRWSKWFAKLNQAEKRKYKRGYLAPIEWLDYYDSRLIVLSLPAIIFLPALIAIRHFVSMCRVTEVVRVQTCSKKVKRLS